MSTAPPVTSQPSDPALRALAPLFFFFIAAGIATVMLGPLLPSLIARWQLKDAQAGTLFTTFFIGQLIGSWFATRNLRFSILLGAAFTSAGTLALAWASFHTAHLALFAAGLGLGATLTSGNVIAGTSTSNRARALALLNVSWSVGAIACALLIRICAPFGPHTFYILAATLLALGGLFLTTLPRAFTSGSQQASQPTPIPLTIAAIVLFAVSMLLYVGNENALGGWLPSFSIRNHPVPAASTIALLYWLSELLSRLLMTAILSIASEAVLYCSSLAVLLLTETVLILTPHPSSTLIVASTVLCGAALGPLYPLVISFLLAQTGPHARIGPLFALAALGGASLPWFTGIVSTHFGNLRPGLFIPAAATLLMLALAPGVINRRSP